MPQIITDMFTQLSNNLFSIGWAVLILIGGWLLALLIAAIVRGILQRTSIDNQLAEKAGMDLKVVSIETIISKTIYYLILLVAVIAALEALNLAAITGPLSSMLDDILGYVPNLIAAGILALVAWLIATFLRMVVSKGLGAIKLDDRLGQRAGVAEEDRQVPLSETLAMVIYWFVWLLFLPAIIGALNLSGILGPIQDMIDGLLAFLPNVVGALLILVIGWFIARIVRQIVTNLLAAMGADGLGERVGLAAAVGGQTLSGLIGTIVYVLIMIPVLIASLDALQIAAISGPATEMLNTLLLAVPAIFGAVIVLAVTYFVARLVAGLVTSLLTSIGFNKVPSLIGLGGEPAEGQRTLSEVVGYLVLIGLMLFATIEASELLGFGIVAELVAEFLAFAAQVVLGLIIFGLGLYFANLARNIIRDTVGKYGDILSRAAQMVIIFFSAALGLRQMGIADDIVNLAFGLLLGAVAVAIALAFGLGSRDIAGNQVKGWLEQLQSGEDEA